MKMDTHELNTLIAAVQHYKRYSEKQVETRHQQGWDTQEQDQRIQTLDDIEEKLFDLLDDRD